MIRIRFHGRGGHGVKTAGRIAGTAAFLAGHEVQDSPVYGAERRGAPVSAFTRIDKHPIRERGVVEFPDLIVVADETLLADKAAAVLAGQESTAALFVNMASAEGLAERYGIQPPVCAYDLTTLTHKTLGKASALSAGLGAAAARLTGLVAWEFVADAVREELTALHAKAEVIERNLVIAEQVFQSLAPATLRPTVPQFTGTLHLVDYDPPRTGTSSIVSAGNAVQRNTGDWRVERPLIDPDVCTRCGLCFVGCPDGAISLAPDGLPLVDYDHCKGCMLCAHLCPLQAIGRQKEVRAW